MHASLNTLASKILFRYKGFLASFYVPCSGAEVRGGLLVPWDGSQTQLHGTTPECQNNSMEHVAQDVTLGLLAHILTFSGETPPPHTPTNETKPR